MKNKVNVHIISQKDTTIKKETFDLHKDIGNAIVGIFDNMFFHYKLEMKYIIEMRQ